MLDPNLLHYLQVLKGLWPYGGSVLVGGAAGVAGTKWKSRGRRQTMRRHLFKELGENYARASRAIHGESKSALIDTLPRKLDFSYFEAVQKEPDTLHDIDDYSVIRMLYANFRSIADAPDFREMSRLSVETIGNMNMILAQGSRPAKALLKYASKEVKAALKTGAEHGKQGGFPDN